MKVQIHSEKFVERCTNIARLATTKMVNASVSSWSIGAIITAISAWTAGILYV
jgi:hypothetical protein